MFFILHKCDIFLHKLIQNTPVIQLSQFLVLICCYLDRKINLEILCFGNSQLRRIRKQNQQRYLFFSMHHPSNPVCMLFPPFLFTKWNPFLKGSRFSLRSLTTWRRGRQIRAGPMHSLLISASPCQSEWTATQPGSTQLSSTRCVDWTPAPWLTSSL